MEYRCENPECPDAGFAVSEARYAELVEAARVVVDAAETAFAEDGAMLLAVRSIHLANLSAALRSTSKDNPIIKES